MVSSDGVNYMDGQRSDDGFVSNTISLSSRLRRDTSALTGTTHDAPINSPDAYDINEEIQPYDNDSWSLVIFTVIVFLLVFLVLPLLLTIEEIRETVQRRNNRVAPNDGLNEESGKSQGSAEGIEEEEEEEEVGENEETVPPTDDAEQQTDNEKEKRKSKGTEPMQHDIPIRVDEALGPSCVVLDPIVEVETSDNIVFVDKAVGTNSRSSTSVIALPENHPVKKKRRILMKNKSTETDYDEEFMNDDFDINSSSQTELTDEIISGKAKTESPKNGSEDKGEDNSYNYPIISPLNFANNSFDPNVPQMMSNSQDNPTPNPQESNSDENLQKSDVSKKSSSEILFIDFSSSIDIPNQNDAPYTAAENQEPKAQPELEPQMNFTGLEDNVLEENQPDLKSSSSEGNTDLIDKEFEPENPKNQNGSAAGDLYQGRKLGSQEESGGLESFTKRDSQSRNPYQHPETLKPESSSEDTSLNKNLSQLWHPSPTNENPSQRKPKVNSKLKLSYSPVYMLQLPEWKQQGSGYSKPLSTLKNKSNSQGEEIEIQQPVFHQIEKPNREKRRKTENRLLSKAIINHKCLSENSNEDCIDNYGSPYKGGERDKNQETLQRRPKNIDNSLNSDNDTLNNKNDGGLPNKRKCLPFPPISLLSNEPYGLLSLANFAQAEVAYHSRPSDEDFLMGQPPPSNSKKKQCKK